MTTALRRVLLKTCDPACVWEAQAIWVGGDVLGHIFGSARWKTL